MNNNFFLVALVSLLFITCNKETELLDTPTPDNESFEIADNVIVLDSNKYNTLIRVDQNGLHFDSDVSNDFNLRDIVVSEPILNVPGAENGFLLKISQIVTEDGKTILYTEQAYLNEAIKNCDIKFTIPIQDLIKPGKSTPLNIDFSNIPDIIDKGIGGHIHLNPDLIFVLQISNFKLQNFEIGFSYNQDISLQIETDNDFAISRKKIVDDFEIKKYTYFLGVFPLVFTSEFDLSAEISLIGDEIKFNHDSNFGFAYGVEYQSGNFDYVKNSPTLNHETLIEYGVHNQLKFILIPSFELGLYSIFELEAECSLSATFKNCNAEIEIADFSFAGELELVSDEIETPNIIPPDFQVEVGSFKICDLQDHVIEEPTELDFIDEELVNILDSLGFTVYGGPTPPDIQGVYFSTPLRLLNSTVPKDYVGKPFNDMTIYFENQNKEANSILFNYEQSAERSEIAKASYIFGSGNEFSVFAEVDVVSSGQPAIVAVAVSGIITEDGIKNLTFANFMIEDFGDPYDKIIDVHHGRVLHDADGLSERVSGLFSLPISEDYTKRQMLIEK